MTAFKFGWTLLSVFSSLTEIVERRHVSLTNKLTATFVHAPALRIATTGHGVMTDRG